MNDPLDPGPIGVEITEADPLWPDLVLIGFAVVVWVLAGWEILT